MGGWVNGCALYARACTPVHGAMRACGDVYCMYVCVRVSGGRRRWGGWMGVRGWVKVHGGAGGGWVGSWANKGQTGKANRGCGCMQRRTDCGRGSCAGRPRVVGVSGGAWVSWVRAMSTHVT